MTKLNVPKAEGMPAMNPVGSLRKARKKQEDLFVAYIHDDISSFGLQGEAQHSGMQHPASLAAASRISVCSWRERSGRSPWTVPKISKHLEERREMEEKSTVSQDLSASAKNSKSFQ